MVEILWGATSCAALSYQLSAARWERNLAACDLRQISIGRSATISVGNESTDSQSRERASRSTLHGTENGVTALLGELKVLLSRRPVTSPWCTDLRNKHGSKTGFDLRAPADRSVGRNAGTALLCRIILVYIGGTTHRGSKLT